MTKKEQIKVVEWKIKLADAIITQANFNFIKIEIGDKIEAQLGTVWIGNSIINIQPNDHESKASKCPTCGEWCTNRSCRKCQQYW